MNAYRTIVVVIVLFFGVSVVWPAGVWKELPALPEGLAGFAVWNHDGSVQIAGGTSWVAGRKIWSDRVMELDEKAGRWREVGMLPYPLAYGGYLAERECLWLMGGHNAQESTNRILRLDGATVVSGAELPSRWRFARGAAVAGTAHFVVRREARDGAWEGVFLEVNPRTGQVAELPPLPHGAWVLPAVSSVNGRIVVAGGASLNPDSGKLINQSVVVTFDPVTRTWTRLVELPVAARGMSAVAIDAQRLFLSGGFSDRGSFLSESYVLDVPAGQLSPAQPLPAGCMPELVRINDWIYLIGGEDAPQSRSRRVFRASIRDLAAHSGK